MKIILLAIALLSSLHVGYGGLLREKKEQITKDTLFAELTNDIIILSSIKETNSLKSLPASVSIFSPKNLDAMQIHSLKDLSTFVPNYSVADYGSRMTAPVYIRGIGARSGTQTVSMYVDNIPYFNTTSFDTELMDIQRVEVLRGTQSTLYGRNAMGGILNIYTFSPLDYEGTNIKLGGGTYGQLNARISHYHRLSDKIGVSASGYYKQEDGYFKNELTGKRIDHQKNGGGRVKFAWDITNRLTANLSVGLDVLNQGAFPYEHQETGRIAYNSDGYYKRNLLTNGLSFRYSGKGYEINSSTGYQYLNDEMNMDQDYTEESIFQINQQQNQNSISQEFTIKSVNSSNYQWSNGVFGFYDYLKTTPPVYMMEDGIAGLLQPGVDKGMQHMMGMLGGMLPPHILPMIPNEAKFTDRQIDLNGHYRNSTQGAAIFHQSTYNNLFLNGLSITLGARLDYEKTKLDYNASTSANFNLQGGALPRPIPLVADTAIIGKSSNDFFEFLPKAVLKYQINPDSYVYGSVSRGYKTGGHNIQIFADLLQEGLQRNMEDQITNTIMGMMPGGAPSGGRPQAKDDIEDRISFKPEYSMSYELGGQFSVLDNRLVANVSAYYMDVKDVQVTQFIVSGGGRLVANAGKARSKGLELGLRARPCTGVFLYANYGFSDAKFTDYKGGENASGEFIDHSGNYIPFAPRSTFSVGGSISYNVRKCSFIDKITLDTNYSGTGRIYWDEANSVSQGFYGTFDSRLVFDKNIFALEFWGKNLLNRNYNTFYFESRQNHFAQKSKPLRLGTTFKIKF